jgi:hypothetical protein
MFLANLQPENPFLINNSETNLFLPYATGFLLSYEQKTQTKQKGYDF